MRAVIARAKELGVKALRWSERYTKTDMVYLASGGFWLAVGQGGAILFSLALAVAFGHLATQDAYGNYKYVLTIASLLGILSLSGLSTGITQSASLGYDASLSQGFRLNLRWSVGLVIASLTGAAYYFLIAHNEYLGLSLCIIAFFTPFLNGFSLYDSFLIGKKRFKEGTLYYLAENGFLTLCLIVVIFIEARAIFLVLAYFFLSTLANAFFYRVTLRKAENKNEDSNLLKYSGHISVMNIIGAVADKIDSIAVFSFLGPAQFGIYAFAIAIPEQIKGAFKSIVPISMPKFAERSIKEIKQTLWKRIFFLMLVLLVFLLIYVALVPLIFSILFPVYMDSVPYSQVYALSIIFIACTAPIVSVLQAHKKTKELYIMTNASSALLVVLLPVLTFMYGIWGALITQCIYRGVRMGLAAWQFACAKDLP